MSDIDFLASQKPADDQEPKNQADKKEKIIWSKPEENKSILTKAFFSLRSFLNNLNKKKEAEKPASLPASPSLGGKLWRSRPAGGSALAPKPTIDKSSAIQGKALDKNKIRESRREILKLIKRDENWRPKEKKQTGKNPLAGLIERFKKPLSHRDILIDYQQIFNQERNKRSLFARPAEVVARRAESAALASPRPAGGLGEARVASEAKSAKPMVKSSSTPRREAETGSLKPDSRAWAGLNRPTSNTCLTAEKKSAAAEFKDNFLGRFFKMIKSKIAASSRPKLKPFKINLAEFFRKIKLKIAKPERVKSARLAGSALFAKVVTEAEPVKPSKEEIIRKEKEIEIKAKPLAKEKPIQIESGPSAVLETNLIEGEIITFFDWRKKMVILTNAIFIPVFLIAVIYFGLMYYQKLNQAEIQRRAKKLDELTAEIKQSEAGLKEIIEFQARLKAVSQIFAKHIYWTNFFKFLEDNTIKDVYYTGFSGDTGGNYSLDAVGSKFSDIFGQVGFLRNNQKITDVQTEGGEFIPGDEINKTRVKFNLKFSISRNIFTE